MENKMYFIYKKKNQLSLSFTALEHCTYFVMCSAISNETFVRELDIQLKNDVVVLKFHQKIEGDVSCVVWDASIVLAKYLEKLNDNKKIQFKNLNVIELGAGLGCAGLTAACLGAHVILTDLPEALPLLKVNVHENKHFWSRSGGNVEIIQLQWGKNIDLKIKPDLILLTDCVYYKESVEMLVKTMTELCDSNTKILLSQEMRDSENQRITWEHFLQLVTERFNIETIPLYEQNEEFCSTDILVMHFTPK